METSGRDLPSGGLYPMRVVTRLTGLTADTIRAWERRYRAVRPDRTAGNTRKYSADDVRRLMLLRESTQRGHAISSIAALSVSELEQLLEREEPTLKEPESGTDGEVGHESTLDGLIQAYLSAISRFEARRALELLTRAASMLQARDLVFRVVLPILREVGERYSHRDLGIAQEHLVSEQLRGVVVSLTRLFAPEKNQPRILITTPAGHTHEFGALVAALLVASRGLEPLHLGPDLPDEDLVWAVRISKCKLVVLSVVRDLSMVELERLSRTLQSLTERVDVWIGAPAGHVLVDAVPGARFFHDFQDFDLALSEFRA